MLTHAEASQGMLVYDPRGALQDAAEPTAPRVAALAGLRLGILDNSKWNANKLLRGASAAFQAEFPLAAVNYYVKHSFSKDAAPELIEQIARENDIVLAAIGDCGSCCSCCVRDGIALERRGLPSAVIITTEFLRETQLTRRAIGMPDLQPVVISHPVSSITDAEVKERVAQIFEQAQKVWTGHARSGPTAACPEDECHALRPEQEVVRGGGAAHLRPPLGRLVARAGP